MPNSNSLRDVASTFETAVATMDGDAQGAFFVAAVGLHRLRDKLFDPGATDT